MDASTAEGTMLPEVEVLLPGSALLVQVASQLLQLTPQAISATSLGLALLVLIAFLLVRGRGKSSKGDSLLLLGCNDAGKTAVLATLVYKQTLHTHTSMQTNSAVIALPSTKTLRLIDVPGHPRLRDQFREHLADARAVAFVVDANTVSRMGPSVAEYLHQVMHALTSLPPSQTPPELLIVAHKCDLLKATNQATPEQLAINRVRAVLERELEKRRASHATGVGVESMDADDTESDMSGLDCVGNGEFKFSDWEGGEVAFVGTHVYIGKAAVQENEKHNATDGLSSLTSWLEDS